MVKKLKILKDEDYERGKIPMTKFPIRAETFFWLAISEGEKFLDIGVGTGSIAVQAALLGAEVTGIDQSSEAVELTYKNAKKHGVSLHLICGKAPADLPDMLFDKIFIGGASKALAETVAYAAKHLKQQGVIAANFILTSSLETFLRELRNRGFIDIEAGLRQTATLSEHDLWKGENPIYIVSARRGS